MDDLAELRRAAEALLQRRAAGAWAEEAVSLIGALNSALERAEARIAQLRAERDELEAKNQRITTTVEAFIHTELGYPKPPEG